MSLQEGEGRPAVGLLPGEVRQPDRKRDGSGNPRTAPREVVAKAGGDDPDREPHHEQEGRVLIHQSEADGTAYESPAPPGTVAQCSDYEVAREHPAELIE